MIPVASDTSPFNVLQITDVHLRAAGKKLLGVDTWDSASAVLDQALSECMPDALLVTGDVAHDPDPGVYLRFEELLLSHYSGPVLLLPGNHDVLARMGDRVRIECLRLGGWTILGLDSHEDDSPGALVDDGELQRLKSACIAAGTDHLIVATHHPPVVIDCPWLDKDRIQNGSELLEWLSRNGSVRAMVFGHAHQEIESSFRHIRLLGTPSTCFQFEPGSSRFSIDQRKPGYRWLRLHADGQVETTVGRVADFPLTIDMSQFAKE